MSRPLILTDEAEDDLTDIYDYLLQQNERLLKKFEANLDRLFRRIDDMPYLFAKVWRSVRAVRVKGFRYVVYYVVRAKQVEIVAVVHASLDSSVWKSRL